jgi:hypothetical protein
MATADRPRSSALDPATRQQLDELDLLMQRMLALPVNPPDDGPPPQLPPDSPIPENSGVCSGDYASTVTDEPIAALQALTPIPSQIQDAIERPAPGLRDLTQTPAALPSLAPSVPRVSAPSTSRASLPRAPLRLAWPLRPLLWINLAFDWSTGWLGPLGRWLREPGGRALIGWGGLLLLAAALAWLAWDGIGWTW